MEKATMFRLLLDAGAKYDVSSAIYLGDIDRVCELVNAEPKLIRELGSSHMLPLRLAAREGRTEICRLLLGLGADPDDIRNGSGYPILHDAIKHSGIVRLLLAAGAKPDIRVTFAGSRSGAWTVGDEATLLHFAAEDGAIESVQLLLAAGVKVDAKDSEDQTPLHLASLYGHGAVVRLLLQAGADPHAKTNRGHTPLDLADAFNRPENNARQVLNQYKPKS
jgi:ankyrin repeat protein